MVEIEEGGGFDISDEPPSDSFLRRDVASVDEPTTTIRTDADSFVESLRKKAGGKRTPLDNFGVGGGGGGGGVMTGNGSSRGEATGRSESASPAGEDATPAAAATSDASDDAAHGAPASAPAHAREQEEVTWEEPLEAFELDPDFDYDGCKLTPKADMEFMAKEFERTGLYPAF